MGLIEKNFLMMLWSSITILIIFLLLNIIYILLKAYYCRRPQFNSWVGKIPWRRERLPTPVFLGFPGGSASKESTCSVGDLSSNPGLGRSPGEGNGYPLQYSGLENSVDCIQSMWSQRVGHDSAKLIVIHG